MNRLQKTAVNLKTIIPASLRAKLRILYMRLAVEPYWSLYTINNYLVTLIYGNLEDYRFGKIQQTLNNFIKSRYGLTITSYSSAECVVANMLTSKLTDEQIIKLDKIVTLYRTSSDFCRIVHDNLKEQIRAYSRSPYVVCNTRVWTTLPNTESFGPNTMHTDGFMPSHFKVMIYCTGLSEENGSLIIKDKKFNSSDPGTVLLFKNSDVPHGGVSGSKYERLVVELTCLRTFFHLPQNHSGHPNGRHYKNIFRLFTSYLASVNLRYVIARALGRRISQLCELIHISYVKFVNSCLAVRRVNLGSGRKRWIGWHCFDAVSYPTVEKSFFSPGFALPSGIREIDLFYWSHNIEHLDIKTISQMIKQISERLRPRGKLVLKMPDFDHLLELYRSGNLPEINDSGVLDCIYTWHRRQVYPTMENKVAMVFCGYMTTMYGNHFESIHADDPMAYHGPPIVQHKLLKNLLLNATPEVISYQLCQYAKMDPSFLMFNHQSAFSTPTLISMFKEAGLSLQTDDGDFICRKYRRVIPDIFTSFGSSLYLEFERSHETQ